MLKQNSDDHFDEDSYLQRDETTQKKTQRPVIMISTSIRRVCQNRHRDRVGKCEIISTSLEKTPSHPPVACRWVLINKTPKRQNADLADFFSSCASPVMGCH